MITGPLFHDRPDAGRRLAEHLVSYRDTNVFVLGIPRGGMPVAAEVAHGLDADLDLVVARKLAAPDQPELAIGAVTADGERFLNDEVIRLLRVPDAYIRAATIGEVAEARQRERRLRGHATLPDLRGRVVILVDDGLATGATMRAAIRSVRKQHPARVVAAVPVGSEAACSALRTEADDVICLFEPAPFWGVGAFFENFEPTDDAQVQQILSQYLTARRAQRAQRKRTIQRGRGKAQE